MPKTKSIYVNSNTGEPTQFTGADLAEAKQNRTVITKSAWRKRQDLVDAQTGKPTNLKGADLEKAKQNRTVITKSAWELRQDLVDAQTGEPTKEHTGDPASRNSLAPEIKHAAALTAVYMNRKQESEEQTNQSTIELFAIANALEDKLDKQLVATYTADLLETQDGTLAELARNALPPCMHTAELHNLVNTYTKAHENMRKAVNICNAALGRQEGNILSLDQLDEFFKTPDNVSRYQTVYSSFIQAREEIFTQHEQALDNYCNRQDIYEQYVREYYGGNNWFAFQQEFKGGVRPTGMVDITARMLNIVIVIKDTEGKELHRTNNKAAEKIYVTYNGHNHFSRSEMHSSALSPAASTTASAQTDFFKPVPSGKAKPTDTDVAAEFGVCQSTIQKV